MRKAGILALGVFLSKMLLAQATGTVSGHVTDAGGGTVAAAMVRIENALTGFARSILTDAEGEFSVSNVPLQSYILTVSKEGFAIERQTVAVRSNVPVAVEIRLRVAEAHEALTVTAFGDRTLIEPEATGTQMQLSASAISRLPIQAGSRGVESVLLSFPGFAPNANGAIHPRGAHNQMTYVIDGMPISDQLTGAFANSVDTSILQAIELFTGNIPAEYGNKISGVANVTTRSGLGLGRKFTGSTQLEMAQFDTTSQVTQFAGSTTKFGYLASFNTMKSHRFLDQVSIDNLHNGGNLERGFLRLDYQATPADQLRLNLMAGRSSFELANLRSQHIAAQDQRQALRDLSWSLGWLHTVTPRSTYSLTASYRTAIAQLLPSAGDTPVTAAQARHLSTLTFTNRYHSLRGPHTIRAGIDYQHFPVSENFGFAVTDLRFNDPGSQNYIPTLAAFDLSRGGRWFQFSKKQAGNFYTAFAQDNWRWRRFVFGLGLRYDNYRFLVAGNQLQPRVGVAFHIRKTATVLRASYNRTYQTPPNENLLLSSSEESGVLVPPDVRQTLGSALILIRPERQNVYEAGFEQALGRVASLNAAYYHKDARDQQDNDNFFNTGIIFPTSLKAIRVNGADVRLAVLPTHRMSGSLSLTHYHAITTPPFTGGLFLGSTAIKLLSAGPFVIDHDQKLGMHCNVQFSVTKGIWVSGAVRYDSGLVANPSNPQQVARDPDYFDLLPYVDLGSQPPRVRPRTSADIAIGYEKREQDRRRWEAQFLLSNLTNRTALYNFQSIFVGTRLVQPRTAGVKLKLYW